MPFGLHSATATFQRLIDKIIGPNLDPHAFAYLDDKIILGEFFEAHLEHVKEVFRHLKQKLNFRLIFCLPFMKYLGLVVTGKKVGTDPENIESIVKFETAKTIRELRRFLGIVSCYGRFVSSFSQVVSPPTKLLRK